MNHLPSPPSRETWELAVIAFQFFPIFTAIQWLTDWYPAGKTSITSRLNLPGKPAWFIMESPGPLIVLWTILTLPQTLDPPSPDTLTMSGSGRLPRLPTGNKIMAGLYVAHYTYRAWIYPLAQPSMSPIHIVPFLGAILFNTLNGLSIGCWTAGYGPTSERDWYGAMWRVQLGLLVFVSGFLLNLFHDDDLREIRRAAARRAASASADRSSRGKSAVVAPGTVTSRHGPGSSTVPKRDGSGYTRGAYSDDVGKLYMIPKNGLFHFVLYAHYLCEWIEWAGFWIIGGAACLPARTFLINEIATMLPRALAGKRWYLARFGADKIAGRKAIIPGLL